MSTSTDYYGKEMEERRTRFNNVIRGMDMVLINNIPEVDPSVWENWQGKALAPEDCEIVLLEKPDPDGQQYHCEIHECYTNDEYNCEGYYEEQENLEVYQWFAIGQNDAEYLKDHNQYITYSDMLDTYFLAILHFGTAWDYVDSMVNDILGDKEELLKNGEHDKLSEADYLPQGDK